MMRLGSFLSRQGRRLLSVFLLIMSLPAVALTTATLLPSTLSPDCLDYRVVGVCYWLQCTPFGCRVRTSVKVRHYIPDAVVSAYSNTGQNPWLEVRPMGIPNPMAKAGGDGTTNQEHENNLAKFKNADVIGHPGGAVFSQFANASGYSCKGAGSAFAPYFLSTLDALSWRNNVPEMMYPESLVPGQREIGNRSSLNLWGTVYPRGGFLHQADDYKAAAVIAQRAGDIVTRRGQPHVYQPLLARASAGYWPAGALLESDAKTGKWQALTPRLSPSCAVFPHTTPLVQAKQGDYAWALWRPYSCCRKRGQVLLSSTDLN